MSYCNQCKINYHSNQKKCVLCQQKLMNSSLKEKEYFPFFRKKVSIKPFIKYFNYINLMSILISILIDLQDLSLSFSLIVSISNLYAIALASFIFRREFWTFKLSKIILLSLLTLLLITLILQETNLVLDFVLPITLLANLLLFFIIFITRKDKPIDMSLHLLAFSIFTLLPKLLQQLSLIKVTLPTDIAFYSSLSLIIYLLLFYRRLVFEALRRQFHI